MYAECQRSFASDWNLALCDVVRIRRKLGLPIDPLVRGASSERATRARRPHLLPTRCILQRMRVSFPPALFTVRRPPAHFAHPQTQAQLPSGTLMANGKPYVRPPRDWSSSG